MVGLLSWSLFYMLTCFEDTQSQVFSVQGLTHPGGLTVKLPCSVCFKELCRMESKTGTRSSEPQQGHLRPVAPPHRNSSAAAPTPKTSGVAESVYKTNPK